MQPPALVHFHVVSLGWTSGFGPGVRAEARLRRRGARMRVMVAMVMNECRWL